MRRRGTIAAGIAGAVGTAAASTTTMQPPLAASSGSTGGALAAWAAAFAAGALATRERAFASSARVSPEAAKVLGGMAGGLAEACALQPLDVCKTRLQLSTLPRGLGIAAAPGGEGGGGGVFRTGAGIVRAEGPGALYKGLTPFATHLVLKYAYRFGTFAVFRTHVARAMGVDEEGGGRGGGGGAESAASAAAVSFWAGLATGVTEAVLIVTPFEVVKTRLQQQQGGRLAAPGAPSSSSSSSSSAASAARDRGRYRGPVDCATKMVRQEGAAALWAGGLPTVLRQGSNQALNFAAFGAINRRVWGKVDGDGVLLPAWQTALSGLLSSTLGPLCNAPLDVCKTRLMAQQRNKNGGGSAPRAGLSATLRSIVREEGVPALWKGLAPRLMRLAPGQAITWTVVTRVSTHFEREALRRAEF